MPKINVYLPDDLAEAVRVAGIPVSAVCQRALEETVRRLTAIRSLSFDDESGEVMARRMEQFTARTFKVLNLAGARARAEESPTVYTGHILQGMLDEGNCLALLILDAMELDRKRLATALAAQAGVEPGDLGTDGGLHMSNPAAAALEFAVTEAIAFGHNYVGTEHVLLGLLLEPDGRAGLVLRGLGIDAKATRRAIAAAIAGFGAGTDAAASRAAAPTATGGAVPAGALTAVAELIRTELRPLIDRIERLEAAN